MDVDSLGTFRDMFAPCPPRRLHLPLYMSQFILSGAWPLMEASPKPTRHTPIIGGEVVLQMLRSGFRWITDPSKARTKNRLPRYQIPHRTAPYRRQRHPCPPNKGRTPPRIRPEPHWLGSAVQEPKRKQWKTEETQTSSPGCLGNFTPG